MSWQHLSDTTPTARKSHRCFLCGAPISNGERHIRRTGVSDGEFFAFRMHKFCESLTRKWTQSDWDCHDPSEFRAYEIADALRTDAEAAEDRALDAIVVLCLAQPTDAQIDAMAGEAAAEDAYAGLVDFTRDAAGKGVGA